MYEKMPDWSAVTRCLEAVEIRNRSLVKTNRILTVAGALCIAVIGALLLTAATAPDPAEVKAQRFILVDGEGQQYGILGVSESGEPGLAFQDKDGTVRVALTLVGAPGLTLYDSNGKARATLDVPGDQPRMQLLDENETTRLVGATSTLSFLDPDGTERAHLAVLNNEPHFAFFDPQGKARVALDVTRGETRMRLFDGNQKGRVGFGIWAAEPGFVLADENETLRAIFSTSKGAPYLRFLDEKGEVTSTIPQPPAPPVEIVTPEKKRSWGPERATGEPDTKSAGDHSTAWASKTADGRDEWLLLEYENAVTPAAIKVYETYNPGALYRVTVFDPRSNNETMVWSGADPTPVGSGMGVSEIKFTINFKVQRVKLYLKSSEVRGWNEIDAVALIDKDGDTQWAKSATASSTYAE
ncbi:MAG: hypothetical protein JW889_10845 [Verrucomicrobia bacterium]|nr:hypothetical protein [Verrucomicrobiota bacterium]